jgi:hypothetical protein
VPGSGFFRPLRDWFVVGRVVELCWMGLETARSAGLKSSIPHSLRSATMGSTPAARHAGNADASNAASPNANVAEASMTGSQGLTLKNYCVISLPAPIAAGMRIANPMATWEKAPLSTMRNTLVSFPGTPVPGSGFFRPLRDWFAVGRVEELCWMGLETARPAV